MTKRLVALFILYCCVGAAFAQMRAPLPKAGSLMSILPQAPGHNMMFTPVNWYVDIANGGPRFSSSAPGSVTASCTGLGTTPFNPSGGQSQPCPFSDFRYLWDDPWTTSGPTWVIAGSDIVHVDADCNSTYNCRGSGSDSTGSAGEFCFGTGPQCAMPDVPSGTSGNPTIIEGSNFSSCSTTGADGKPIPDPTKQSYLVANNGSGEYHLIGLVSSQHVSILCINGNGEGSGTAYGIEAGGSSPTNGDILLQDVTMQGFQSRGVIGSIGGVWTYTRVHLYMNAQAGLDMDRGSGEASTGSIVADGLYIDWSGCHEEWPITHAIPVANAGCSDDSSGGYGDAWGTPVMSGFSFICHNCEASYNTQDAWDGGHLVSSVVDIEDSTAQGNMGGNLKSGPSNATYINNLINANCQRMSAPITGAQTGYNTNLSDYCRANDQNSSNALALSSTTILIYHNTLVGYNGTVFDIQCEDSSSVVVTPTECSDATIIAEDNLVLGYTDGGRGPAAMWNGSGLLPTTENYNLAFGLTSNPWTGANSLYTSPLLVSQPANPITAESQLDNFNFNLTSGSPAKFAGVAIGGQTTDFAGNAWHAPPSMGGLEFVSGTPTASAPTFSPIAGTYGSAQSVTISTSSSGAIICYNTTGSPATNGTTGCTTGTLYTGAVNVSASETLFAVAGGTGWLDSSVGSAAYIINGAAATPTFSPVAGTYAGTQTVTISTSTGGATLCYTTDGSTPLAATPGTCSHGTTYSTPVSVASSLTLKAIATEVGFTNSSVGSAAYVINGAAATPTFSPIAGTYTGTQSVTLSTATSGCSAHIVWNTTGAQSGGNLTGTTTGTAVTVASSETVYAQVQSCPTYTNSGIGSAAYVIQTQAATPTFSPPAGTYGSTQSVTITTATSSATLCFTTDGSTPTANGAGTCTHGTTYSTPVSVVSSLTLKCIASKSGFADSAVGSALYTIGGSSPSATGKSSITGGVTITGQ